MKLELVFNRKNKLDKNGLAAVQIRAYQKGKCRYYPTGLRLKPAYWSKLKNRVVDMPEAPSLNAELQRQVAELYAYLNELREAGMKIDFEALKNYYENPNGPDELSFLGFYEKELDDNLHTGRLSSSTIRKQRTTLNYLRGFVKKQKELEGDILFSQLDYELVKGFDAFLRAQKLAVNTIHMHHKHVKRYLAEAVRQGLMVGGESPYQLFKVKTERTERLVLNMREVEKISALEFEAEEAHLERIRDAFLLACYTGLRHSDIATIPAKAFRSTEKGIELSLSAQKTGKSITLPLHILHGGKPQAIAAKYLALPHEPDAPMFPGTNQYINRKLKTIATRANIRFKVTMHVARHTFATHMASKVPVHILQHLLQHTKIETTMIYVHMSETLMRDSLERVKW